MVHQITVFFIIFVYFVIGFPWLKCDRLLSPVTSPVRTSWIFHVSDLLFSFSSSDFYLLVNALNPSSEQQLTVNQTSRVKTPQDGAGMIVSRDRKFKKKNACAVFSYVAMYWSKTNCSF